MGDAINTAARLMCLSTAMESILCDEHTYNLCQSEFTFESLGDIRIKGRSNAIPVFRPLSSKAQADELPTSPNKDRVNIVGRLVEKDAIATSLRKLKGESPTSLLFEGEGGQGLSTLCEYITQQCQKNDISYW